ncbi:MAG TPA: PDZ domain-containing protein [Candidatus Angelobacter sp.]
MIQKLSITVLTLGLMMPASAMAPGEPPAQINPHTEGFFYSAGRSYLGVDVRDITSERVSALKLKEERGVEVTTVDQDAPAGKAGLKEHDVIVEFNGAKVESEEQFRRMIRETPPGRNVTLGISRDGAPMNIQVQIGDRAKITSNVFKIDGNGWKLIAPQPPDTPEFNIPFDIQVPTYTPSLGVQVDNVGQQLGEYFGVKNGEGLLVKSVEKGSPAEKAGMKAGDVITRADNEKITDRADLRRAIRTHRSGGKMTISILRDRHEQNLTIDLPARKSRDSSGMQIVVPDEDTVVDLDLDSVLENVEPAVDKALEIVPGVLDETLLQVRPEIIKAQRALTHMQPSLQQTMRKLQLQLERSQSEFQKNQNVWFRESDMI